jgi:hypothetical protein
MARVGTQAGNPFHTEGALRVACTAGVIATATELAAAFSTAILDRLQRAGWSDAEIVPLRAALTQPTPPGPPPPGLFQLHRSLTGLRRAHQGASW